MPPKKNNIEKELKKRNKEAAEKLVNMLEQENSDFEDVVPTVNSSASSNDAAIAVRSRSARIENPIKRAKEATRSKCSKTALTEKTKPSSQRPVVKGKPDVKRSTEKTEPHLKRLLKKIDVSSSNNGEMATTEKEKPISKRSAVKDKPDLKRSTEKIDTDLKRPLENIENVSSSEASKHEEKSKDEAKIAKKRCAGKKIGKATKAFCYEIDCQKVEDSVDVKDLQQFVMTQLKVDGKKNNTKNTVTVCEVGSRVLINSKVFLPKRSLRFLTKKFLKKSWNIQVISQNKNSYELKYVGTE